MIVGPTELRSMGYKLTSDDLKQWASKLVDFHTKHSVSDYISIITPIYWSETILQGLIKIHEEFPQIKFSNIYEKKNKLRVVTVPTHKKVEEMKVELYNEIDTLILDTINSDLIS